MADVLISKVHCPTAANAETLVPQERSAVPELAKHPAAVALPNAPAFAAIFRATSQTAEHAITHAIPVKCVAPESVLFRAAEGLPIAEASAVI